MGATAVAPTRRAGVFAWSPNKFPALGIEGELDREGEGLFDKMNGIGAHEVIIESPSMQHRWRHCRNAPWRTVLWGYATACWT